jgi:hypothetical protein
MPPRINGLPVAPRRPGAGADLDGPGLDAFDAAGYRGVPARNDDAEVDHVLRPLATAAWALVRQASGLAAFALGT